MGSRVKRAPCLIFFWEIAWISLTADGLISRLYVATAFQLLNYVLEAESGLPRTLLESGKICRVFG